MASRRSPTASHIDVICPGRMPLSAKRGRFSFCQLTLMGGNGRPLNERPWQSRSSPRSAIWPDTVTMHSCSSDSMSSASLRATRRSCV